MATIALDQPETRNALSDELLDELLAALAAAKADAAVRCVVLTSTHEKVFSSGGNLAGFAAEVPLIEKHFEAGARFPRAVRRDRRARQAALCAANGHVLAGALGLALACDLIVANEGVRFGTPEINVGVFPFMIMALIYRNVGRKKTNELLLLGEQISAEEAERIGIVNKVVPADEFDAAVAEWAARLAAKSPVLMRLGKDAMFRQQDMAFADALEFLQAQLTLAFSTEDIQEGVRAFFEKRDPGLDRPVSARVAVLRGRTSDRTGDGVRGRGGAGCGRRGAARRLRGGDRRAGRAARGAVARRPAGRRAGARGRGGGDRRRARRGRGAGTVRVRLHDRGRDPARARAAGAGRARRLARRARRLQHARRRPPRATSAACASRPRAGAGTRGFGDGVDPARVVLSDARDLDAAEREELGRAGLAPIAPGEVAGAVRGEQVFLHLDLDVLDPSEIACTFPAPGGLSMDQLRALLAQLADAAEIVGIEVTSMAAPAPAPRLAELLLPLLR